MQEKPGAELEKIPVYRPYIGEQERANVIECVDTKWISSLGSFVRRFEDGLRHYTRSPHVLAVSNGTVALHLALHCLGVGPGDEVIVPTLTYIASVNTIRQTGATPVFAESRRSDWVIDPDDIVRRITKRTKALLPVHLYGVMADMVRIREIATLHGLKIVEDAAEAVGSALDGRSAGTFGDIGTFSFFGNKTITTGEGGAVLTADAALAEAMLIAKGQGQSLTKRYWHTKFGFNYRMTNIAAAIGVAQLQRAEHILARKRHIASLYRRMLDRTPVQFQERSPRAESSEWLVSLLLPPSVNRDSVIERMAAVGIETRPLFYCAHTMPVYQDIGGSFPVAEDISRRGISLPSFPELTDEQVERVVGSLRKSLGF
jgi:perosamine synthetase